MVLGRNIGDGDNTETVSGSWMEILNHGKENRALVSGDTYCLHGVTRDTTLSSQCWARVVGVILYATGLISNMYVD